VARPRDTLSGELSVAADQLGGRTSPPDSSLDCEMILENRLHADREMLLQTLRELRGRVRNLLDRKIDLMQEEIRQRTECALFWDESFGAIVPWIAELFSYLA
jgi:hypothetical protein